MSVSTRTMKPLSVELKLRASKLDVRAQFRVAPGSPTAHREAETAKAHRG